MTPAHPLRVNLNALRAEGFTIEVAPPASLREVLTIRDTKKVRQSSKAATLQIVAPADSVTAWYCQRRAHSKYATRKAAGKCARCPAMVATKPDGKPSVLCATCLEANKLKCARVRAGETGIKWADCIEKANRKARERAAQ